MARPASSRPTDSELEALQVFWDCGEAAALSVRDVHDVLGPRKGVAMTTVSTLLRVMADKGLLRVVDDRRPQRYAAVSTRDAMATSLIDDLKRRLFGGSVAALLQHALGGRRPTRREVDEVKAILDELK